MDGTYMWELDGCHSCVISPNICLSGRDIILCWQNICLAREDTFLCVQVNICSADQDIFLFVQSSSHFCSVPSILIVLIIHIVMQAQHIFPIRRNIKSSTILRVPWSFPWCEKKSFDQLRKWCSATFHQLRTWRWTTWASLSDNLLTGHSLFWRVGFLL